MTIEAGSDKLASIRSVNGEMQWSLLLRLHGGGGRVSRKHPALADYCWYVENAAYLTRAQAAQAVYEGGQSAE